ncbi:MAG: cytochrome c maturation protein CcmE [Xanthomonadales bacterium]|nr:cytochrome c maturation protein CcmE [Xanthomonadales bacterium]
MTPTRKKRLTVVLLILLGVSVAAAIAMTALQENLLYFLSPSEVAEQQMPTGRQFRLGGLVKEGSVNRATDSLKIRFRVTDGLKEVEIHYDDILPDLFREGQGIIAIGSLDNNRVFQADEVLAKHDEEYMAPEVADALQKAGHPRASKDSTSVAPSEYKP